MVHIKDCLKHLSPAKVGAAFKFKFKIAIFPNTAF